MTVIEVIKELHMVLDREGDIECTARFGNEIYPVRPVITDPYTTYRNGDDELSKKKCLLFVLHANTP